MTERHAEIMEWMKCVLLPSPSSAAALCTLFAVWWGLMHGVLLPEWQSVTQRARAADAQMIKEQQIKHAVAHVTVLGRLVAADETAVMQVCHDIAARHAVGVVGMEWHVAPRMLSVSLQGGMMPLLAWWDQIGRLALLGEVQQWQFQPAEDTPAPNLFQLTITLHLGLWRWEALAG